ncbi:MAG: RNA polymerase sigma factor [Deltaproteobacteria bacterium]|nr:MAG: RNA polymerase sigma factor [Deltaproteobacteria bacterium]
MSSPSPPATDPSTLAYGEVPDAALFLRASEEDPEAIETLHRRHHSAWCRTATGLLGRIDLGEEVVQEVWIHGLALLQDGRLDPGIATAAFRRMVVRRSLDLLRRRRRRDRLLRLFGATALKPEPARPSADPLLGNRLRLALDQLPEGQRVPLLLREIDGWSGHEIAEALDLGVDTVDQRISRARKRLRELLEKQGITDSTPARGPDMP